MEGNHREIEVLVRQQQQHTAVI